MDKGHLSGDLLCDLAEGQLAPAARREAEAHVEGCADCRRELEALQGYFQDMSSLETFKAPDRFLTKVHGRIAKASPWKRLLAALSSPRLIPVPVAAFCLMMVGAFLFYLVRKSQPESSRTVALSVPVKPSETSLGDEGRVATIPQNRYAISSPKKRSADSPDRQAPMTLASRATRAPAAEAKANAVPEDPAPEDAAISNAIAQSISKNKVSKISGRAGRATAEGGETAATGPGGAGAGAAAVPVQPDQLALAAPSHSPSEKAFTEEAGKGDGAGLKDKAVSDELMGNAGYNASSPTSIAAASEDDKDPDPLDLPVARSPRAVVASKSAPAAPAAASPTAASRPVVASRAASRPKAAASPATESEVSGRMAERDEAVAYAEPGPSLGKREAAAPAPPSVTPKPWAPLAYTLKWNIGRADAASFRPGMEALGIRVLRQEQGSADRYELEVPAVKVASLEQYLRGYGALVPAPKAIPGRKNGVPIRMTLWVTRTP